MWLGLAVGVVTGVGVALAQAAEQLRVDVGTLKLRVKVAEIERFAEGEAPQSDLEELLNRLPSGDRDQLRAILRQPLAQLLGLRPNLPANLPPVLAESLLREPMGQLLLSDIGEIVRAGDSESVTNGAPALAVALQGASQSLDRLTLVDALRSFPGDTIALDAVRLGQVGLAVQSRLRESRQVVGDIGQIARDRALASPPLPSLPSLAVAGRYGVESRSLSWADAARGDRPVPLDLYWPQGSAAKRYPTVVISHGFGSSRAEYHPLARFLASHGLGVVVVEHTSSNHDHQRAFFAGQVDSLFDHRAFIDRPRDIRFALDALAQRPELPFAVERVLVVGHSFGGYTALALAGGRLDFAGLERTCARRFQQSNVSLLLQCRALELGAADRAADLRDRRVAAVLVGNPVGGSLWGDRGLDGVQVPALVVAGTQDFVTPLVFEQALPFVRLGGPARNRDKFLALVLGSSHIANSSDLGWLQGTLLPNLSALIEPNPDVFAGYGQSLTLAFVRRYLLGQTGAERYLSAAYGRAITQPPYDLLLLDGADSDRLRRAIERARRPWPLSIPFSSSPSPSPSPSR